MQQTWFWKGSQNFQLWPGLVFKYPSVPHTLFVDEAIRVVCKNTPELVSYETHYNCTEQSTMRELERQSRQPH